MPVASVHTQVASWDALSPNPELPVDRVLSLHHFSDSLSTILVLEGGDIVLVREAESLQDGVHIEIMGSIDEGITAASWSPDEELLAISTKARTVVFMSRNFEGITDAAMSPDDLRLSKQVSVGWGKKETQFQGKGAKALRDPTIPEKVDQGVLSARDDGRVTISWRGDGAFVAVNSVEPGARRVIRVYSRDGVLDSVSEAVDGMEGALSWRPAGNLLASTQRKATGIDVIFFERNGLRHGEFSLRPPEGRDLSADQVDLHWNADSSVLAVSLDDRVQLWTMGNYHWYLKQEIRTTARPASFTWHPEKALRVAVLVPGGAAPAGAKPATLIMAEYILNVTRGTLDPPHDHGAVAVVDGQTLKITPFRTANVPPPMALYEIQTQSAIADVAFSPNNFYMGVLHQDGVDLYKWQVKGQRSLRPSLEGTLPLRDSPGGGEPVARQISVGNDGSLQVLVHGVEAEKHCFQPDPTSGQPRRVATRTTASSYTFSGYSHPHDGGCLAQDESGRVFCFDGDLAEQTSVHMAVQQPWSVPTGSHRDGTLCVYGLSRNGHLYANGPRGDSRLLVKNCTSFLVTPDHLILTTTNHLLKFVHLAGIDGRLWPTVHPSSQTVLIKLDLEVPPDDPENDERCRSIERGAKLVTAMPTNMSLVLQMPRGNLETVFPRAMVVAGIRNLIEEKNYTRAFSYCRTQRVDMNILYDHRPEQFLENVSLFLEQLADVAHIDLFLSSLRYVYLNCPFDPPV